MQGVNFLAVFASAIASMVVGSLWYGPLFGKKFMEAIGMDSWSPERKEAEKKKMGMTYAVQFVASLVMFYFLSVFMNESDMVNLAGGIAVGFWAWLGFVVPVKLGDAIWGGNMTLFWIGVSNMFVTLLVAGAIIGVWK